MFWRVAVASVLYAWTQPSMAAAWPPEFNDKPLAAYSSRPNECYVLLKPLGEYVFSSKAPVCTAVLENLNQFCGEPPQFNQRKIHARAHVSEPNWVEMDPVSNFDLVKQTFLTKNLPASRADEWQLEERRLHKLAQDGVLQFSKADLRGVAKNLRSGVQAVYRLQNAGDPSGVGQNQSLLMFVPSEGTVPKLVSSLDDDSVADVWLFDNELFLVEYVHWPEPIHRVFVVSELTRPLPGPEGRIGATERCVLQFKKDRER